MEKLKTQKGITLIALIITIVVLLILAGVAIGTLQESNIIGQAQSAVSEYEKGKDNENGTITDMEVLLEKYTTNKETSEVKYYVYDPVNTTRFVLAVEINDNNMKYKYYRIEPTYVQMDYEDSIVLEDSTEEVSIYVNELSSESVTIESPYKKSVGGNYIIIKDDKIYKETSAQNLYNVYILNENFDASILE